MSSNHRLHIDPAAVLGVSHDATLQQIRDAYRAKAKRYHPDTGGEEWAFRILVQSYEILSTARVASATEREANAPSRPPRAGGSSGAGAGAATAGGFHYGSARPGQAPPRDEAASRPFGTEPPRAPNRPRYDAHESVRPGVMEPSSDPAKVVEIEKVAIRFEAEFVWLITDRARDDRYLSCCLNITWPDPEMPQPKGPIPDAATTLKSLEGVFQTLNTTTNPLTASSTCDGERFTAWLSYPNDERAQAAFNVFRQLIHPAGLVVKQWSRDLVIPRQWR